MYRDHVNKHNYLKININTTGTIYLLNNMYVFVIYLIK